MSYVKALLDGIKVRVKRLKALRSSGPRPEMTVEELWRMSLEHGPAREHRHFMSLIPAKSRCKLCHTPFDGFGGLVFRVLGTRGRSEMNPTWCKGCMELTPLGGAEVDLSMLFVDIRGSTTLAEKTSSKEYVSLLNRFYAAATTVLVRTDAFVDKFVGDEVIGLYVPGFAGDEHPRRAIEAGQEILQTMGYQQKDGPWLPVGIGIHTGRAFVGKVGDQGVTDITALGDAVNVTARLASEANAGEILVSEDAYHTAEMNLAHVEQRTLELKGKSTPTTVFVLTESHLP